MNEQARPHAALGVERALVNFSALRFNGAKGGSFMKKLVVLNAIFFSGLAVAQSLPRFGTAKFGEAAFGVAEPVPFMPLWATITLAVALWVVVYLMRKKEI